MDIEVIPVRCPPDDHEVRLPSFKWTGTQEHLEMEIEKKLSHYGPIYRISVFRSSCQKPFMGDDEDTWFAYVSFYSAQDYQKAVSDGVISLGGSQVFIKRKRRNRLSDCVQLPLNKAQDLMSHFLVLIAGHRKSYIFAFYSAMKTAFSKFIIIRLGNGKITAEVDTSQCDPFLYDSALDHPVVKVSEIPYDPEAEEYSELLQGISEEELNCLLDASVTEEL